MGFVVFIERALFLHKGQIGTEDFIGGIKNLIRKGRLVEALALCEDTPGPMARIVKSALLHYGEASGQIRNAIQSAAIVEIPLVERRVGAFGDHRASGSDFGLFGNGRFGASGALFSGGFECG